MTDDPKKHCLACERGEADIPLLRLDYQGERHWICSQHLPLLIHDPSKLIGRLPGAENLGPSRPPE